MVAELCDIFMFPTIHTPMHILTTFPVKMASAVRPFSTLQRLKTKLRLRMIESRLDGLALMRINRRISIDIDKVIN